jgi:hypothetical protein
MAEQSVRITSLPNENRESVALELWKQIRYTHSAKPSIEGDLNLFLACRSAVLRGDFDQSKL